MKTIKIAEVESGFVNVQNGIVILEPYKRLMDCIYSEYTIEIPDGFEIAESNAGTIEIYHGEKHVQLCNINHKEGYVTGVSVDGFHHFRIIAE